MSPEARELYLFAISDGDLYRQQGEPIIKNLARKVLKHNYQEYLAIKLWGYLANNAAKKYTFDFDVRQPGVRYWAQVKGYGIFTTTMRREAAKRLEQHYKEQVGALAAVMRAKGTKS